MEEREQVAHLPPNHSHKLQQMDPQANVYFDVQGRLSILHKLSLVIHYNSHAIHSSQPGTVLYWSNLMLHALVMHSIAESTDTALPTRHNNRMDIFPLKHTPSFPHGVYTEKRRYRSWSEPEISNSQEGV